MGKCHECGNSDYLLFTCRYCGLEFCSEHRLPESHSCKSFKQVMEQHTENWKHGRSSINWEYNKGHETTEKYSANYKHSDVSEHVKHKSSSKKYSLKQTLEYNLKKEWLFLRYKFIYVLLFFISVFALTGLIIGDYIKIQSALIPMLIFFGACLFLLAKLLGNSWRVGKILLIIILIFSAFMSAEIYSSSIFDTIGVKEFFTTDFSTKSDSNGFNPKILTTIGQVGQQTTETISNTATTIFPPTDISEVEQLIYTKTNNLRQTLGKQRLGLDPDLSDLARMHSQDMGDRSFFDHTNPDGLGPTERAQKMGIQTQVIKGNTIWTGIGENISEVPANANVIGCGYTTTEEDIAECAFNGWVHSPGHYANMINSEYEEIGVGVAIVSGTAYLTQDFR